MHRLLLALSLALAWLGVAKADQIATSTIVSGETIAARIAETLATRLPVTGRYHVAFVDPAFAVSLPATAQGRFDIASLNFDASRQAFAGALTYMGTNNQLMMVNLSGAAYAVIDVPALAHDVASGDIIGPQDLTTIALPAERTSSTLIMSADNVTGQAARRALRARQPLYAYDIKKPVVVKKGELVTLLFALPGIELTAQGQALADGGKGDVIAVLNARSRRSIEGRVSGAGTVTVQAPSAALALAQH